MTIALPLAGVMALWLGVMRLAEKSGLMHALAKLLRPLMTRLFPDVPAEHPAMGSMIMNMAANMLGLANAATPLGLRAMQDLEKLNPRPGTATNAMCTFLALNTSSVQLIPASAVAVLAAAGSVQPTAIIGTALVATLCSTAVGLISVKSLEKLPFYRLPPVTPADKAEKKKVEEQEPVTVTAPPPDPLAWRARLLLAIFGAFFLFLLWRTASANCEMLVRTDPVVAEVWYHIDDADQSNDDAQTKQLNGNGKGFEPFEDANKSGAHDGAEKFTDLNGNGVHDASVPAGWAKATAATVKMPDGSTRKEWRFRYVDLPGSGPGTLTVRLLEASSSRDLSLPAAKAGATELTGIVARSWGPQVCELFVAKEGGIRSHPLKFFLISCVEAISLLAIPFLLSFFPLYAALRRVPVYEEFVEGAKEGFQVSLRIIPFLVAILAAVG
ncbi:MAG: nucleoside recognition domain-containing protein, partial [Chthoniobacterales bacterium]